MKKMVLFYLGALLLVGCYSIQPSNNAVQQIYPIEHNQISIPPEIDKDNVIKAIFPDSEIKKVTETVSDNGWEYLVIGKKWAVGPASEIDLPADYNPFGNKRDTSHGL